MTSENAKGVKPTLAEHADAALNRVRQQERRASSNAQASSGTIEPASNERLSASLYQQSFGTPTNLVFGKIVYAMPYAHWYRVQLDGGGDLACSSGTAGSTQPLGVRSVGVIPPGTHVAVWRDPNAPFGVVAFCLPTLNTDGHGVYPDWISQGSNGGLRRERYYNQFAELFVKEGGIQDWSNSRPCDGAATGEWGWMNDLGNGVFIDAVMSFFRVDELCGMWLFYMDRLLRLAGHNLDIRTAIDEYQVRVDNGEGITAYGSTPYPFEALGAFAFGTAIKRDNDDADVHYKLPEGKSEPVEFDQQAFYRYEEFRGYLGQAFMRQVQLPPLDKPSLWTYSSEKPGIGVFRESISMEGGYALQTAHSWAVEKRVLIPSAKRIKPIEDPTGDDLEAGSDYKFAGLHGSGPEHVIQGEPTASTELPHILTAVAVQDMMAYVYNWKQLHPFAYHTKDFLTPEEAEHSPFTTLQHMPELFKLAGQTFLPTPDEIDVEVDHRYNAKYYEAKAGIYITSRGGVVIRDASGSELRMAGGQIVLAPSADLMLQPGRHVIAYAGDDIVLRAHNSIDITAAKHDVRLKAEHHVDVLAGNGGAIGRILLECQSSGPVYQPSGKEGEDVIESGVILKAKTSEIIQWGNNIYLRTGGGDVLPGQITLDAAKGKNQVRIVAQTLSCHLQTTANFSFPLQDKTATHMFSAINALIPTPLQVKGPFFVTQGGITCRGNVQAIDSIFASDRNVGGQLYDTNRNRDKLEAALKKSEESFKKRDEVMTADYISGILQFWYPSGRPGSDDVIRDSAYAPRNDAQMRVNDFKIPETYWQQIASEIGAGTTWVEPTIAYQGKAMMPHPGKKAWSEDASFYASNLKFHDLATGVDEDRGSPDGIYASDPTLNDWIKGPPQSNYPLIMS